MYPKRDLSIGEFVVTGEMWGRGNNPTSVRASSIEVGGIEIRVSSRLIGHLHDFHIPIVPDNEREGESCVIGFTATPLKELRRRTISVIWHKQSILFGFRRGTFTQANDHYIVREGHALVSIGTFKLSNPMPCNDDKDCAFATGLSMVLWARDLILTGAIST